MYTFYASLPNFGLSSQNVQLFRSNVHPQLLFPDHVLDLCKELRRDFCGVDVHVPCPWTVHHTLVINLFAFFLLQTFLSQQEHEQSPNQRATVDVRYSGNKYKLRKLTEKQLLMRRPIMFLTSLMFCTRTEFCSAWHWLRLIVVDFASLEFEICKTDTWPKLSIVEFLRFDCPISSRGVHTKMFEEMVNIIGNCFQKFLRWSGQFKDNFNCFPEV